MTLPASGAISLNDVNVELSLTATAQIGLNDAAVRGLFGVASGAIAMSDGYGKANETVLTNEGTINGQSNRQQITVSDFISANETLVVPSGFWVWSDDTAIPAIIIDITCTLRNEGKIIGKGGPGRSNGGGAGGVGGPAIKINSGVTGVTIINTSGSYIAGGGGGGGEAYGAGGGGAGGGLGASAVFGGVLNAVGNTLANYSSRGDGGGSGGGGGGSYYSAPYQFGGNGGGGGRILPGTGGAGGSGFGSGNGGAGGSAGAAGSNGTAGGSPTLYGAGGGGGWGASGGAGGYGVAGGAGGDAINDSGETYTLSNSGTIYGAT